MINFGVREEAIAKTAASPGWAYVPDTGKKGPVAALQPSSRKRAARTQATASSHDTTAKQDAKILRELIALDKETLSSKTEVIPVPIRHRDNAGRVSHGKVTPDVRKILQSKKTWANYLDDFEALGHIQPAAPAAPATPIVRAAPGTATPHLTSKGTRSHKKKDPNAPPISTPLRKVSTPSQATPIAIKPEASTDIRMPDAPVLSIPDIPLPPPHPGDNDPLLISRIPSMPTQAEIEKLLAAPPLSYNEARGEWSEEDRRKPVRTFCEVCGYWGRVRCTRCGGRVCALECLTVHQEECFTRYGA